MLRRHRAFRGSVTALVLTDSQARDEETSQQRAWPVNEAPGNGTGSAVSTVMRSQGRDHRGGGGRKCAFGLPVSTSHFWGGTLRPVYYACGNQPRSEEGHGMPVQSVGPSYSPGHYDWVRSRSTIRIGPARLNPEPSLTKTGEEASRPPTAEIVECRRLLLGAGDRVPENRVHTEETRGKTQRGLPGAR